MNSEESCLFCKYSDRCHQNCGHLDVDGDLICIQPNLDCDDGYQCRCLHVTEDFYCKNFERRKT